MAPDIPVTRLGASARIGLLADSHCHAPGASDLPGAVLDAFRGVDLVIHLGDMGEAAVLDRLAGAATDVVATRGRDDPGDDTRIAPSARLIEAGGLAVGALFDLSAAGLATIEDTRLSFSAGSAGDLMKRFFGRPIDVVAFGATHRSLVAHHRGVLLVNPGSPTLPVPPGTTPGTVAVLELRAGVATVEILRI